MKAHLKAKKRIIKNLHKLVKSDALRVDEVILEDVLKCHSEQEDTCVSKDIYTGTLTIDVSYDGDGLRLLQKLMKGLYDGV